MFHLGIVSLAQSIDLPTLSILALSTICELPFSICKPIKRKQSCSIAGRDNHKQFKVLRPKEASLESPINGFEPVQEACQFRPGKFAAREAAAVGAVGGGNGQPIEERIVMASASKQVVVVVVVSGFLSSLTGLSVVKKTRTEDAQTRAPFQDD